MFQFIGSVMRYVKKHGITDIVQIKGITVCPIPKQGIYAIKVYYHSGSAYDTIRVFPEYM